MIKNHAAALGILLTCLAPGMSLRAQIGEPAPPLAVEEWIKGKPVQILPGTNIYVVEIWVTWSSGARASISRLNEIQKRFADRGVLVAAVSDEPIEKIKGFMQHDGAAIEYSVGADDLRQTARTYMIPVHQQGLPYAFVVGTNANLLWHGFPTPELEQTVERIVAGRYDVDQARRAELSHHQMEQYLGLARRGDLRAASSGRTLLSLRTNNVEELCDLAFQIATHPKIPKRDIDLANEALDQAQKVASTNASRVELTRAVLLFETGKTDEALECAKKTLAAAKTQKEKDEAQACLRTMQARLRSSSRRAKPIGAVPEGPDSSNTNTSHETDH